MVSKLQHRLLRGHTERGLRRFLVANAAQVLCLEQVRLPDLGLSELLDRLCQENHVNKERWSGVGSMDG